MVDFQYLYRGLCALASCHRVGPLAGHLGAAVVAGYFLGEDQPQWPEAVFRGIEGELDRIIAGEEAIWFNARQAGITPRELFRPFPEGKPVARALDRLAQALTPSLSRLRQSGHNVIFATLAMRALGSHEQYATEEIVSGIAKLLGQFRQASPGRGYYGKPQGWRRGDQVKLPPEQVKPYRSLMHMVETTLGELAATASVRKQGYGGLWHLINHAAAVVELDRLGYRTLARTALKAHAHHLALWRGLPVVEKELGPMVPAEHDPWTPAYWQGMLKRDQARLTHRIKTLFGYFTLRRLVEDAALLRRADRALRYLMA